MPHQYFTIEQVLVDPQYQTGPRVSYILGRGDANQLFASGRVLRPYTTATQAINATTECNQILALIHDLQAEIDHCCYLSDQEVEQQRQPVFSGGCNTDLEDPAVQAWLLEFAQDFEEDAQSDAAFLKQMRDSE